MYYNVYFNNRNNPKFILILVKIRKILSIGYPRALYYFSIITNKKNNEKKIEEIENANSDLIDYICQ